MRRFVFLCAALAALVLPPAAARAQSQSAGWETLLEYWLKGLPNESITDARCFEALPEVKSIAVVGIPSNDTHVDAATRERIDQKIKKAAQGAYELRDPEAYRSVIEEVTQRRGGATPEEVLNDIYQSDMFLKVTVERPWPRILHLSLQVTIMRPEKKGICTTDSPKFPITIDVETLDGVAEPSGIIGADQEYDDLGGSMQAGLLAALGGLPAGGTAPVPVYVGVGFEGRTCAVKDAVTAAFRAAAQAIGGKARGSQNGVLTGSGVPPLSLTDLPADGTTPAGQHIFAQALPAAGDAAADDGSGYATFKLAVSARDAATSLTDALYTVAVKTAVLEGCSSELYSLNTVYANAKSDPSHHFGLRPLQDRFVPGRDKLAIDLGVDEPLYLYCWMLADDNTAQVLFPNAMDQLRAPFKAGRSYRFPDMFFKRRTVMRVEGSGRSLFGCFSSVSPVSDDLKQRWVDDYAKQTIPKDEIQYLLEAFRAQRTVGERYVWINHEGSG